MLFQRKIFFSFVKSSHPWDWAYSDPMDITNSDRVFVHFRRLNVSAESKNMQSIYALKQKFRLPLNGLMCLSA